MARVNKSVIGFVSGKVGDVVFREMHGKKFVSATPKKYKISQSRLAKKGRADFAAVVKFAVTVNSIPQLKNIWSKIKAEGTNSYHRIIKHNAKLVNAGMLSTQNKITPDGISLNVISHEVKTDRLELTISFPSKKLNFPVMICSMLLFSKDAIHPQFTVIQAAAVNDDYSFNINFSKALKAEMKKNPDPILYIAVIGNQIAGKKLSWTSTAAVQL